MSVSKEVDVLEVGSRICNVFRVKIWVGRYFGRDHEIIFSRKEPISHFLFKNRTLV